MKEGKKEKNDTKALRVSIKMFVVLTGEGKKAGILNPLKNVFYKLFLSYEFFLLFLLFFLSILDDSSSNKLSDNLTSLKSL